jgi:lysyl-tRNA synthetase, class II
LKECLLIEDFSLTSVGYDRGARLLEIEFRHGGVYRYHDVPSSVFAELMRSPSKGRFFNERVRDSYRSREV